MGKRIQVTANGDYDLPFQLNVHGLVTISWSNTIGTPGTVDIGGATVRFCGVHREEGSAATAVENVFPLKNGALTSALIDDQGFARAGMDVYVCSERIVAKVSGYTVPFYLWVS